MEHPVILINHRLKEKTTSVFENYTPHPTEIQTVFDEII